MNQEVPTTRIILFRHAEKPVDDRDPHLSEIGRQHAVAWVSILTAVDGPLDGIRPAALYAPRSNRQRPSQRPMETLKPLEKALGLEIRTPVAAAEVSDLAALLRAETGRGPIVVCWVHDFLPALARALGVKSELPPWKGKDFDQVWVIEIAADQATLRDWSPTAPNREKDR